MLFSAILSTFTAIRSGNVLSASTPDSVAIRTGWSAMMNGIVAKLLSPDNETSVESQLVRASVESPYPIPSRLASERGTAGEDGCSTIPSFSTTTLASG